MKRINLNHLLLLVMALCAISASAYDFMVDGICYNINGNEATVTNSDDNYNHTFLGEVSIPNIVTYNGQTYAVTSIGEYAFSGCYGLISITIPNSVTSIGQGAFQSCSGLSSIDIPNSVTFIGDAAFTGCGSLTAIDMSMLVSPLQPENIPLPIDVTELGMAMLVKP